MDLSKRYPGGVLAVDGLSLRIRKGFAGALDDRLKGERENEDE
jgi:hypothetical protein